MPKKAVLLKAIGLLLDFLKRYVDKNWEKAEVARIQEFASQQSTRDEIKMRIKNYLWDDRTGLPMSLAHEQIDEKTDAVFSYLLLNATSMHQQAAVSQQVFNG